MYSAQGLKSNIITQYNDRYVQWFEITKSSCYKCGLKGALTQNFPSCLFCCNEQLTTHLSRLESLFA